MSVVTFKVGGTKFEISRGLIEQYPSSRLAQLCNRKDKVVLDHNPLAFGCVLDYLRYKRVLVPRNVAREVVELQLREFNIPYDEVSDADDADSALPSYEAAMTGYPSVYKGEMSLRDTVHAVSYRRLETLIQDVLLPFLKRHAKRGHQKLVFLLVPHVVNSRNLASELDSLGGPHEWIHLPLGDGDVKTTLTSTKLDKCADDDLPDLRFLSQPNNLADLKSLLLQRSGVRSVSVRDEEISVRTENDFGLLFTKSVAMIEIDVQIV